MKFLQNLLMSVVNTLKSDGVLPDECTVEPKLSPSKNAEHGDYATNLAFILAKQAKRSPKEMAEILVQALPSHHCIQKVELAGPGFINFFLQPAAQFQVLEEILSQQQAYGQNPIGAGQTVQIEFVSANPTGPLHVGHGRGAAYGSALANIFAANGYEVHREYYVNDAGRQMNILAVSVWLRYLELLGEQPIFPAKGYQGEYVIEIARHLQQVCGERLHKTVADWQPSLPQESDSEEAYLDALIEKVKNLLSENDYEQVFQAALQSILADIREDLHAFGVNYDTWFSEKSLVSQGQIKQALVQLKDSGFLYEKEGALWFRSTAFGDDKDRVVQRDNGQPTYFASDIAYHLGKFERKFDLMINIWGADHHGYVKRLSSAIEALGLNAQSLQIRLVQFAILYRGKERLAMSTRSGSFVTLRSLREEIGADAARFFYVTRKCEQHMDFDLELAKSKSKDNPVYYVQYAHARICSLLDGFKEQEQVSDQQAKLELLVEAAEFSLVRKLAEYPITLKRACEHLDPQVLSQYLIDLASLFHSYYNSHKILLEDLPLCYARVSLSQAVQQVLANGLDLLGVSAPTRM